MHGSCAADFARPSVSASKKNCRKNGRGVHDGRDRATIDTCHHVPESPPDPGFQPGPLVAGRAPLVRLWLTKVLSDKGEQAPSIKRDMDSTA